MIAISFFVSVCKVVTAQSRLDITHYSTAEGLSDNRVGDLIKDKDGFMWFASWAGISRFDGYQFLNFKSSPGDRSPLKSNRIDEIKEDLSGRYLWLKAYDKHIYRFDKRTQEFVSLPSLVRDSSLEDIPIQKIALVRKNEVWLITEGSGIILITDPEKQSPKCRLFSRHQGAPNKLPSNKVLSFHPTNSKDIWVETSSGLVRFHDQNTGTYKVITPDWGKHRFLGIAQNQNRTWFLRDNGTLLWIGKNENKPHTLNVPGYKPIRILASQKSDILYSTTERGELFSVSKNNQLTLCSKTVDSSPLYYIFEDKKGGLWIESERYGIIKYDPFLQKTEYLFPAKSYSFNPLARNLTLFEDSNSVVWSVINGELFFFDKEKRRMEPLASRSENYPKVLSTNITRMFYDMNGVLWIGNGFDGIEKIVFRDQNFHQEVLNAQSSNRIDNETRGLLIDKENRLWAGTKSGALYVYKNKERILNLFNKEPVNRAGIYTILQDKKDRIWLGTKSDGLIKAEPVNAAHSKYAVSQFHFNELIEKNSVNGNSVYTLLEDSKGRIWAGSYGGGLILIEEKAGKTSFKTIINSFKNYPKKDFKKIRHLAEDAYGKIWVGTTDGLLIFDPAAKHPDLYKFQVFKKIPGDINSLGGNDIQFIYKDSKRRMWVLTTTGGLNQALNYNKNSSLTFRNYSVKEGLPSDFLLSCNEDVFGNLWIATQNGLSRFSADKNTFQNFNYSDGLPESSFSEASCTRNKEGKLWFGNTGGYLSFDPKDIITDKIEARIAFTNIQVNREDLLPGSESPLTYSDEDQPQLRLNYDQNVVSIDFSVLDFRSVNKQNYYTRLVGFDNVWRSTEGERRTTYLKLPPGKYVFEVKCANDELYKKVPVRSLNITILPPPWKTTWAYLFYAICAVAIAFIVRRIAITMLKLRQSVEVERRLSELKLSFFTQISHELRTPLTLIINPGEEIKNSEQLSARGQQYIDVVIKNSRRMLRMVNQVLDLRKLQSGQAKLSLEEIEITDFISKISDYFIESILKKDLQIILNSEEKIFVKLDQEKIEIVIFNLLTNAIKFSPQNGRIYIEVRKNLEDLTLVVKDEGPGVREDELKEIFKLYYEGKQDVGKTTKGTGIGLALAKELVELHGGVIYAEHNEPRGLKVVLNLPMSLSSDLVSERSQEIDISPVSYSASYLSDSLEIQPFQTDPEKSADRYSVLIVEDNDDLRNFLASKFSDWYKVETAVDGEDAWEKARTQHPDLIVSDITMPGMDGIQLVDKIKNDPETSHIPVILLTAKAAVETQIEALRYGADFYITKPFKMELLQFAVKNIIASRRKLFNSLHEKEQSTNDHEASVKTEEDQALAENNPISKEPVEIVITEFDKKFLKKIIDIIESRLQDPQFNIEDVAESMKMSRSSFYRKFKSLTGLAPVEFVREFRLKKSKELFDAGNENVSQVAYEVGFNNPKYFSSCFKTFYNVSPSDYIKRLNEPGGSQKHPKD